MNMPWRNLHAPAKLLAICAVILLVSSGLCGLQWVIALNLRGDGGGFGSVFMALGIFELTAMAASIVIAVGTLIVWGFKAALNKSQPNGETTKNDGRTSDPQTLFPPEKPPQDNEKK